MLTIEKLKAMEPNTIFAHGTFSDTPEGIYVMGSGLTLTWVAVRGGIHDWAIYYGRPHIVDFLGTTRAPTSLEDIARNGDKLTVEKYIKILVPCDNKAFEMYRY